MTERLVPVLAKLGDPRRFEEVVIGPFEPSDEPGLDRNIEWDEGVVPRIPTFVRIWFEPNEGAVERLAIDTCEHCTAEMSNREKGNGPAPLGVTRIRATESLVDAYGIETVFVPRASEQAEQTVSWAKTAISYVKVQVSKGGRQPETKARLGKYDRLLAKRRERLRPHSRSVVSRPRRIGGSRAKLVQKRSPHRANAPIRPTYRR